jgi:hypothetical protein
MGGRAGLTAGPNPVGSARGEPSRARDSHARGRIPTNIALTGCMARGTIRLPKPTTPRSKR